MTSLQWPEACAGFHGPCAPHLGARGATESTSRRRSGWRGQGGVVGQPREDIFVDAEHIFDLGRTEPAQSRRQFSHGNASSTSHPDAKMPSAFARARVQVDLIRFELEVSGDGRNDVAGREGA